MKNRVLLLFSAIITFILVFYVGSSINIGKDIANELNQQFLEKVKDINDIGIFLNNFSINLVMFIPVIGFLFGIYSSFSTGLIFNAISVINNINIFPLSVFLSPFGILEVIAYGIAMSRSIIYGYELLIKRLWKKSLKILLIELLISGIILFIAAIIEWAIIGQLMVK